MTPDIEPRLLPIRDAAAYLGMSPRTLGRLAEKGEVPQPVRLGRNRRWDRRELDRWLDRLSGRADDSGFDEIWGGPHGKTT